MRKMKEFLDWLAEVRELARHEFEFFAEWYSFEAAYEDGMSPRRAVEECRGWIAEAA